MTRTIIQSVSCSAAAILVGGLIYGESQACPPEIPTGIFDPPAPAVAAGELAPMSRRDVDLAICLDTSGSMRGLIDAARQKLWDIVNDLALAKPTPRLRVALLTYGNDGHNAENGWVNLDVPFTDDLDLVSKRLFALTTNGGTELVGRVLDAAGRQLEWSPSEDALKIAIVAGNESADQDQQMSFRDVCRTLISRGIMIDSIYCGSPADNIAPGWREVAALADGHFAAIDHDHGTIVVSTPFDNELAALSAELNTTYVAYGALGKEYAGNQVEQDMNAANFSPAVAAQRCETKAGAMYDNRRWDLVDACKDASFKIEDLKDDQLPEAMRAMSVEERKAYVADMASKRAEIQTKVVGLSVQRQQYVAEEMKKQAGAAEKSFDVAIRKAVRAQAASKGFEFAEIAPAPESSPQPESGKAKDDGC